MLASLSFQLAESSSCRQDAGRTPAASSSHTSGWGGGGRVRTAGSSRTGSQHEDRSYLRPTRSPSSLYCRTPSWVSPTPPTPPCSSSPPPPRAAQTRRTFKNGRLHPGGSKPSGSSPCWKHSGASWMGRRIWAGLQPPEEELWTPASCHLLLQLRPPSSLQEAPPSLHTL